MVLERSLREDTQLWLEFLLLATRAAKARWLIMGARSAMFAAGMHVLLCATSALGCETLSKDGALPHAALCKSKKNIEREGSGVGPCFFCLGELWEVWLPRNRHFDLTSVAGDAEQGDAVCASTRDKQTNGEREEGGDGAHCK